MSCMNIILNKHNKAKTMLTLYVKTNEQLFLT